MVDEILEYLSENYIGVLVQVKDHLYISFLSIVIACAVGIILGYYASKSQKSESIISMPFQTLRVIPSLALLVLCIPIMGTGVLPAVVSLTVLAIPPVLLNTIVAFKEVPFFMVETARGMGMTRKQTFWQVKIPLATPIILSGVRTALVEVIASATLAAKIGAGGLGEIIFTGIGLNRADLLIIGGLLVAVLSLGCGWIFDLITKKILKYQHV